MKKKITKDGTSYVKDIVTTENQKDSNKICFTKITTIETPKKYPKNIDIIATTEIFIKTDPEQTQKLTRVNSNQLGTKYNGNLSKKITSSISTKNKNHQNTRLSHPGTSSTKPNSYAYLNSLSKNSTKYKYSSKNTKKKNIQSPSKMSSSLYFDENKYQLEKPEINKKKALSPEPSLFIRKTINRGKPVENIQITNVIYSSKNPSPAVFHLTERLNCDNLYSAPIQIPLTDRHKLRRSGKVVASSSCDGIKIQKPIVNLKGKSTIYQHARGIGMTNDRSGKLNPLYYSSEIKKLEPINQKKGKEKVEIISVFRSSAKNIHAPNLAKPPTKNKIFSKKCTYNKQLNYKKELLNNGKFRGVFGKPLNNKESFVKSNNNKKVTKNLYINLNKEIVKEKYNKIKSGNKNNKNRSQQKNNEKRYTYQICSINK